MLLLVELFFCFLLPGTHHGVAAKRSSHALPEEAGDGLPCVTHCRILRPPDQSSHPCTNSAGGYKTPNIAP